MSNDQKATVPWFRSSGGKSLLAIGGLLGLYVLTEHWAHLLPYLPWLFIAACPLMHVFMHGGHGGHGRHGGHGNHGHDAAPPSSTPTLPEEPPPNPRKEQQ